MSAPSKPGKLKINWPPNSYETPQQSVAESPSNIAINNYLNPDEVVEKVVAHKPASSQVNDKPKIDLKSALESYSTLSI